MDAWDVLGSNHTPLQQDSVEVLGAKTGCVRPRSSVGRHAMLLGSQTLCSTMKVRMALVSGGLANQLQVSGALYTREHLPTTVANSLVSHPGKDKAVNAPALATRVTMAFALLVGWSTTRRSRVLVRTLRTAAGGYAGVSGAAAHFNRIPIDLEKLLWRHVTDREAARCCGNSTKSRTSTASHSTKHCLVRRDTRWSSPSP